MAVSQKKLQLSKRIADKPKTYRKDTKNAEIADVIDEIPALSIENHSPGKGCSQITNNGLGKERQNDRSHVFHWIIS